MPIKIPKGFQRRKSSGNALDEVRNPSESTFKVFERPRSSGKGLDALTIVRPVMDKGLPQPPTKNSFEHDEENLFSVITRPEAGNRGGTDNSLSTAPYDSAGSSTRLSTSTNPSSVDTRSDKNVQIPGQRPITDVPAPPPPSHRANLLASSRRFSFVTGLRGNKEQKAVQAEPVTPAINLGNGRERAMTASSASTATPPRLFDTDLSLENSELDGFQTMFDNIGKASREQSPAGRKTLNPTSYPPSSYTGIGPVRPTNMPVPRPSGPVDSSPYSWMSDDSRDSLMRSPSPSKTITQDSPLLTASRPVISRKPLQRSAESGSLGFGLKQTTSNYSDHSKTLSPTSEPAIDESLFASAQLASRYQNRRPTVTKRATSNNKIMTPAEFERYKQQQEMDRRRYGVPADEDSDDGDKYDDDDDDELARERDAAKQRRKQEAHLAVYRQTMMKVTGEQVNLRPNNGSSLNFPYAGPASRSTPELNRLSRLTLDTKLSGKSSAEDDDEDEDVPLGILAAHGFPNKNRPPARLGNSLSNSNLRATSQQQAPAPANGESSNRGGLPVFARHLPQDPYGLVNQTNRESIGMQIGGSAPVTPSGPATAHPIHPSGLVGVIAGEERARAMRRGSPNAQGSYDLPPNMPQHPGMMRSQTMGNMPPMPYPGMMPGMPGMPPGMGPVLTPADHAQLQMAQQMTEMMRMQMQWMQQMQSSMGGQQPFPPGMPPPMQGISPTLYAPPGPMSRPQSIAINPALTGGQRTMSSLTPSMANWNMASNGNYAHSIAPSERSNIGLASRYRPVSTIIEQNPRLSQRSATFTSSTPRPWSHPGEMSPQPPVHASKSSVGQIGRKSPLGQDEEDDEKGWAEMKAKKEKKQRTWKLRKGNALQELYNG